MELPDNQNINQEFNYDNIVEQINSGQIKDIIEFEKLPEDITISTMTITCKINTIFNVVNMAKYLDLAPEDIVCIKHGNIEDLTVNRCIDKKKLLLKNKKKKKGFYNQVTVIVKISQDKKINLKFFTNGSMQITGCKNMQSATISLLKVFNCLKVKKQIYNEELNQQEDKPFVSNPDILDIKNLYNIKICMINSNFNIGFHIDRDKLYEILLQRDNIECSYDQLIHACVNIKYSHPDKIISIFVFESGAIIITGARNCKQIIDAYEFINKYILSNYYYIIKNSNLINDRVLEFIASLE